MEWFEVYDTETGNVLHTTRTESAARSYVKRTIYKKHRQTIRIAWANYPERAYRIIAKEGTL